MTLYYRDASTELFPDSDIVSDENEYLFKYLKDKNNNVFAFSYSRKPSKNKKLRRFLAGYPDILEKIKSKELETLEEIVAECNNVNGKNWKQK